MGLLYLLITTKIFITQNDRNHADFHGGDGSPWIRNQAALIQHTAHPHVTTIWRGERFENENWIAIHKMKIDMGFIKLCSTCSYGTTS